MTEHGVAYERWPRYIGKGLRITAWAAFIGEAGSAIIAFLIPIVGGARDALWITRYWSIAFEALALVGLTLATRLPRVRDATCTFGTSALIVRVLAAATLLTHMIIVFLPGVLGSQHLPIFVILSWRLIRPTAKVLLVWYVGSLLGRFGVVQLGRALHWTSIALAILWIIDYPAEAVVMTVVNPEGAIAWSYTISAMVLGGTLLVWTCACLLRAATLFQAQARGRCVNCGYVLCETSRCSECGASY